MHAIVEFQGCQYRVKAGDRIHVPLMEAEPGSQITLDRILLLSEEGGVRVGQPTVAGAKIEATVLRHFRGPKILVGKFKKRKDYRRRNGYRDDRTEVEIRQILS